MTTKNKKAPALKLPEAKVLLAIPSGDSWLADFGMSVAGLMVAAQNVPAGYSSLSVVIQNTKGSILPQIRTKLVLKALEIGATHILFIDSDMTFPPATMHRLLEHKVPVVAANCVTKSLPPSTTARFKGPDSKGIPMDHWDYKEGSPELVEVWRVGTGVMLIETDVFRKLPQPWFPITQVGAEIVGEDWGFCQNCEDHGIPIVVDTLMSPYIGHIGKLEYTADLLPSCNK